MKTILCAGNRYCAEDSFGPMVYDVLCKNNLPKNIELIDAGLAGLDLLCHFEKSDRVIVIDSVSGFSAPEELVTIRFNELQNNETIDYGHSGGLQYLLHCLPALEIIPKVDVILIGFEGIADKETIAAAASLALESVNA